MVSTLVGKHSAEHIGLLVEDFHRRAGGRGMNLMASDDNPADAKAILERDGREYQLRRRGRGGRIHASGTGCPRG